MTALRVVRNALDEVRAMTPLQRFAYYIRERYTIRARRNGGVSRADWTNDAILRTYKFTNVRRAWDYTSTWLTHYWYMPNREAPLVGFAAAFARFFCYVPTFEAVGFPNSMNRHSDTYALNKWIDRTLRVLTERAERGEKVFTSAYVIGGVAAGQKKVPYVLEHYLRAAWDTGLLYQRGRLLSCDELHAALHEINGWGDFMTQEVVLDLMETHVLGARPLQERREYGYAGPGAIRGLNRIAGREVTAGLNQSAARAEMRLLWSYLCTCSTIPEALRVDLTVHDVEFNLCEFDKYSRALLNEGTPKQFFKPREDTPLELDL